MTNSKEKKCCKKGCLNHKYHCGYCNAPLTYSPQNFASRPEDIPNHCPNDCQGFYHPEKEAKEECEHQESPISHPAFPQGYCIKCGLGKSPQPEAMPETVLGWEDLREKLADIEHQRWADWQKYVHSKCNGDVDTDYESIPRELYNRWERQIKTPYSELTEKERDSDREQVDRYLPILKSFIKQVLLENTDYWQQKADEREINAVEECKSRMERYMKNAVESAVERQKKKCVEVSLEAGKTLEQDVIKEERQRIVELVKGMKEKGGNPKGAIELDWQDGYIQALEEIIKLIKDK